MWHWLYASVFTGKFPAPHIVKPDRFLTGAALKKQSQTRSYDMPNLLHNWLQRHQNPASKVLHALGIPLIPVAGIVAVLQLLDGAWSLWWRPLALLVVSYALQWLGHLIEGNDMGELILLKKLLGKPYVAVSPRYAKPMEGNAPAEAVSATERNGSTARNCPEETNDPAQSGVTLERQDGAGATTP